MQTLRACLLVRMSCAFIAYSEQEQLDLVCTSGRPFCLLDVRLMGPKGQPLQPGSPQVGEVQCRGPTVFEGYWQLPQASQEAFSHGWFCTGDLATINKAGYITVVDRIKDMILHGQRPLYTSTHVFHCHIAWPCSDQQTLMGCLCKCYLTGVHSDELLQTP